MIFGLLYFGVVIMCVNRSRSSFILYRIVKRHSRQSNVRRIWTCADNVVYTIYSRFVVSGIKAACTKRQKSSTEGRSFDL